MHPHPTTQSSDLHPRALATRPFDRGLHDVGNGVFAYLQPDGSWGWSNAGLIVSGDQSLLVDTLFDLKLTREMLESMRRADRRADRIDVLVNTHANPDHTNGNSLLPGARVITSEGTAREMQQENPVKMAVAMRHAKQGGDAASRFLVECFGAFDFEGIPHSLPSSTFSGALSLRVGDKELQLIELGAAHTGGDIIIYSPSDRVVFAGDLLFVGGHPIMWAGPIGNWIAACDYLLGLDVEYVVPGHGPITDKRGVRAVRDYLALVQSKATAAFEAGTDRKEASRAIAVELQRAGYGEWSDGERVVATVSCIYRQLANDSTPMSMPAMFAEMAAFKAAQSLG